jgi:hypothetical protein
VNACSLHAIEEDVLPPEVVWSYLLKPGQHGLFLCDEGSHYVAIIGQATPMLWSLLIVSASALPA